MQPKMTLMGLGSEKELLIEWPNGDLMKVAVHDETVEVYVAGGKVGRDAVTVRPVSQNVVRLNLVEVD